MQSGFVPGMFVCLFICLCVCELDWIIKDKQVLNIKTHSIPLNKSDLFTIIYFFHNLFVFRVSRLVQNFDCHVYKGISDSFKLIGSLS